MSNPAVIELKNGRMSIGKYRIEDNIGESIHLHIGDWRFDLTLEELNELTSQSVVALNKFINIDSFRVEELDPLFLSQISEYLPDLKEVRIERIFLSKLLVDTRIFGIIRYKSIKSSRVYKAYSGNERADEKYSQINKVGETNKKRRDSILESVRSNGYPYSNKYIILFNNQNIIRDGQHRAAALYYLYGDKEIEVKRFIFKDNKHIVSWKNYLKRVNIKNCLEQAKNVVRKFLKIGRAIKKRLLA